MERTLSPHLRRLGDPFAYTWEDTWDASTPAELHEASYGSMLGCAWGHKQGWRTKTHTLVLSHDRDPDFATDVFEVAALPTPPTSVAYYARRLDAERRVVNRGWLHLVSGLPLPAAIMLSYITLGPTIFAHPGDTQALVLPPLGPSRTLDLRDPWAVSEVYRGLYLEKPPIPHSQVLTDRLKTYGYNPIPEFKRLFELTQD